MPITESVILGEEWREKHTDRNNYEMHQLQINFNFDRKLEELGARNISGA